MRKLHFSGDGQEGWAPLWELPVESHSTAEDLGPGGDKPSWFALHSPGSSQSGIGDGELMFHIVCPEGRKQLKGARWFGNPQDLGTFRSQLN